MITTRSLLRDFLIAAWMLLNLQRLKNARLRRPSLRACLAVSFFVPCEGRSTVPCFRAAVIERLAFFNDARWHTTRVLPGGFARSAEARLRAFGTLPPAAGFTLVSGAGSGQ